MREIRLLTFNCSAIPLLTPRVRARLDILAREIERLDPDIVCLQEVGLLWDARRLGRRLRGRWPHAWWARARPGIVAGGLVLFSREPFSRARFAPFSEQGPWLGLASIARLTRKGMMFVEWDEPRLRLVHAHPLADYNLTSRAKADYGALQWTQLEELRSAVLALAARESAPLAVAGDLNAGPDHPLIRRLVSDLSLTDLMDGVRASSMVGPDRFRSPFGLSQRTDRIDYILVSAGSPVSGSAASYALDEPVLLGSRRLTLSDHRAVIGSFAV